MVHSSSSKSNHSQGKSTHTAFKVGPPGRKPVAVSVAKAKDMKQQSMKKYTHSGKFFSSVEQLFCESDIELKQMKMQKLSRKM